MRMHLVQYTADGAAPVACVREDLDDRYGTDVPALFYTTAEAHAFIAAMCGLIHTGGNPAHFEIVPVEHDGRDYRRIYGDYAPLTSDNRK